MNNMKKLNILIVLSLILSLSSVGQDYSLSQMNESPVLLNPANTGLASAIRINMNYRQQWRSISKPFNTIIASADGKILSQGSSGSSLGLGILIVNDQAGTSKMSTLNANLAIMGKVMLNEKQSLSAGIIGGLMQRKIDVDKLTWTDQFNGTSYDSSIPHGEIFTSEKRTAPDVGVGLQWSYGRGSATLSSNDAIGAQVGFAAYHVNMPNTGFHEDDDRRYVRFLVHSSFSYGIKNTPLQLNPIIIAQIQGPARMYYGGTYIKYRLQESSRYTGNLFARSLNAGMFYRFGDSFVAVMQLEYDQFAFGISYDINMSQLTTFTYGRGAMEISLRYIPVRPSKGNTLL
jgi:type IX secretion system PorP/SprF family membrane protein